MSTQWVLFHVAGPNSVPLREDVCVRFLGYFESFALAEQHGKSTVAPAFPNHKLYATQLSQWAIVSKRAAANVSDDFIIKNILRMRCVYIKVICSLPGQVKFSTETEVAATKLLDGLGLEVADSAYHIEEAYRPHAAPVTKQIKLKQTVANVQSKCVKNSLRVQAMENAKRIKSDITAAQGAAMVASQSICSTVATENAASIAAMLCEFNDPYSPALQIESQNFIVFSILGDVLGNTIIAVHGCASSADSAQELVHKAKVDAPVLAIYTVPMYTWVSRTSIQLCA